MTDEKALLNRIIEIVDYDREQVRTDALNSVTGSGRDSEFIAQAVHNPGEYRVEWWLKETLRQSLNAGTVTPRCFTARSNQLRIIGLVFVASNDDQFAKAVQAVDDVKAMVARVEVSR